MVHRLRLLIAALFAAVAIGGAMPATALACSSTSHCYGLVDYDPSGTYTGGMAYLNASRLSVTNPNAAWVNHEMWVTTNSNPNAYEWAEAGLTHGVVAGVNHGRSYFWAEQNTAGSYAEHFVQNISLGTTYIAKISYSGSGSWGIYLNGSRVGGTSSNHGSVSGLLQTGGELITDNAQLTATSTNLQKRGSDNSTWSYDWPGSIIQSGIQAGWGTYGKSMWDKFN
jgi:hypothetical protein